MSAGIGILALQGNFESHASLLRRLGLEPVEVRRCLHLDGLDGLVIPGGESTTLLNLMQDEAWFPSLRRFHHEGGALLGTCAGAILLAREVLGPRQASLGLLDAVVERNGFGRQVDSFETRIDAAELGGAIDAVFIRAPRLLSVGPSVRVLARLDGQPVLVRQGRVLAATFHPELTGDTRVHRHFLGLSNRDRAAVREASRVAGATA